MFTARVIFFSLFPLFFFGLPVSGLLFPKESIAERWVKVPFLGFATTLLVTQNLIYIDIPVKESVKWVWLLGIFFWIVWLALLSKNKLASLSLSINKLSFMTGIILFLVYIIHGFGIFGSSARYYVGRAWADQSNYVAIAQFLADYPFSTSSTDLSNQPYAQRVAGSWSLKYDRIGQSVYHAFVFTSANTDAKSTFEVISLISPVLIAIAVFSMARSIYSDTPALVAMLWAGILPAVAMVHLESFFSQALGTPFLLVFPFFMQKIRGNYSNRSILATAMILATGISIYTEFLLLYLFEIFLVFLAWVGDQRFPSLSFKRGRESEHPVKSTLRKETALDSGIRLFTNGVLLIVFSALLNIGFFQSIMRVTRRVNVTGFLPGIYPWALTVEGIARLWFGDWSVLSSQLSILFGVLAIVLASIAYIGLILNWIWKSTYINFTILSLCIFPLGLRILGQQYQYQFYKLLLTVSPLFIIGLVYFIEHPHLLPLKLNRVLSMQHGVKARGGVVVGAALLMILSGASVFSMAYRSGFGKTEEELGRGAAYLLYAQETREVEDYLESTHNKEILIAYRDEYYGGMVMNSWLAYFARNNKVFLTNPNVNNTVAEDVTTFGTTRKELSSDFLLVTSGNIPCNHNLVGKDKRRLLNNKLYGIYKILGSDWTFVDQFVNPNGVERDAGGEPYMWLGEETASIVVFSGREGIFSFRPKLAPGPSLPQETPRTVKISGPETKVSIKISKEPIEQPLEIPIYSGRNEIRFDVLEKPTLKVSTDSRALLVHLSNICQFRVK